MSSVLASYPNRTASNNYYVALAAVTASTVRENPTTVAYVSTTTETMIDAKINPATGDPYTPGTLSISSGVRLLETGQECVIFNDSASTPGITSPYNKLAVWREVQPVPAGGERPTAYPATCWVKVWSATNSDLAAIARQ
jgi:hypothetical protein